MRKSFGRFAFSSFCGIEFSAYVLAALSVIGANRLAFVSPAAIISLYVASCTTREKWSCLAANVVDTLIRARKLCDAVVGQPRTIQKTSNGSIRPLADRDLRVRKRYLVYEAQVERPRFLKAVPILSLLFDSIDFASAHVSAQDCLSTSSFRAIELPLFGGNSKS